MSKVIEIETKRKPSMAKIKAIMLSHFTTSSEELDIRWGENLIEFKKYAGRWCGFGWIGSVSGQDLAKDLF